MRRDSSQEIPTGLDVLELLADERMIRILDELDGAAMQPKVLEANIREYPHSTLMERLKAAREIGLVRRTALGGRPNRVVDEITTAGTEFLALSEQVETWAARPTDGFPLEGPIPVQLPRHGRGGRMAALAAGWNVGVLQSLSPAPIRRTELCQMMGHASHHQVERRLAQIERAGLAVAEGAPRGSGTHGLTIVGREAMAVVLLAAFWEDRHRWPELVTDGAAVLVEALPVLAPLLVLPEGVGGVCSLTFEGAPHASAVHVTVEGGKVVRCAGSLAGSPTAWCRGTLDGWAAAFVRGDTSGIGFGDGRDLAAALVSEVHQRCFGWFAV